MTTRRRRDDRGIVTIEFAFGVLASVIVMIMLAWAIFLFGVQIAAVDAAGAVARQLARGDQAAVAEAEHDGPANSRYLIQVAEGSVRVQVVVEAHPVDSMPSFRLTATAEAVLEPGQGQPG